jgi:hypothetical protein
VVREALSKLYELQEEMPLPKDKLFSDNILDIQIDRILAVSNPESMEDMEQF